MVGAALAGLGRFGLRTERAPAVAVDEYVVGWAARASTVHRAALGPAERAAYERRGVDPGGPEDRLLVVEADAFQFGLFTRLAGAEDTPFKTIVHECVHTRRPWSGEAEREARAARGDEEGLAEGLVLALTARAGIAAVQPSFQPYVAAYRALAAALGLDAFDVGRRLWAAPPGEVRVRLSTPSSPRGRRPAVPGGRGATRGRRGDPDPARVAQVAEQMFASRVKPTDARDPGVLAWRWAIGLAVPDARRQPPATR